MIYRQNPLRSGGICNAGAAKCETTYRGGNGRGCSLLRSPAESAAVANSLANALVGEAKLHGIKETAKKRGLACALKRRRRTQA